MDKLRAAMSDPPEKFVGDLRALPEGSMGKALARKMMHSTLQPRIIRVQAAVDLLPPFARHAWKHNMCRDNCSQPLGYECQGLWLNSLPRAGV